MFDLVGMCMSMCEVSMCHCVIMYVSMSMFEVSVCH